MDLDSLVRDAFSVHTESEISQERRQRQLRRIRAGRRRRCRRLRRAIPAVAVVGLAVVLIGLAVPGTSDVPVSAATVFDGAAASIAAQPTATLAHGQYLYSITRSLYQVTLFAPGVTGSQASGPAATATYYATRQVWLGGKSTGRYVETRGSLHFASRTSEAAWSASEAAHTWEASHKRRGTAGTRLAATTIDVAHLPTTSAPLARLIATGKTGTAVDAIPTGPHSTFERTARLLAGPDRDMTRSLESALYRVLAHQRGISAVAGVTGGSGARGTEVSIRDSTPGTIDRIIVDPQTGAPLEVDSLPLGSRVHPGSKNLLTSCVIKTTCIVTSVPSGTVIVTPLWTATSPSVVVASDSSTMPVKT